MWKATAGTKLEVIANENDDWDTDPDFINDVTEEEQRWGSRTIEGSGRTVGAIEYVTCFLVIEVDCMLIIFNYTGCLV